MDHKGPGPCACPMHLRQANYCLWVPCVGLNSTDMITSNLHLLDQDMARTEQLKPGRVYSLINVKSDLQKKPPLLFCSVHGVSFIFGKKRKITVEQCTMQQLNNARLQCLTLVHLSHKGTPYITQLLWSQKLIFFIFLAKWGLFCRKLLMCLNNTWYTVPPFFFTDFICKDIYRKEHILIYNF